MLFVHFLLCSLPSSTPAQPPPPPFFLNSSQLQESRWREPTNRNKQFPLHVALEQFSAHLSWLCTSEVSALYLCSLPSAGSSWACLWQCFSSFVVVAVYASDAHLRPCVCLRYLHIHVTCEKSRAHQWALGTDEPCNHLALCSRFPWVYSCSSWWDALHLKDSGSEQPFCYSRTHRVALHSLSFQLQCGHQHNLFIINTGGGLGGVSCLLKTKWKSK